MERYLDLIPTCELEEALETHVIPLGLGSKPFLEQKGPPVPTPTHFLLFLSPDRS